MLALERTPGKGKSLATLGIEVLSGDITDHARMAEIVAQGVSHVMHIAAWLSGGPPRQADIVNVDATRALAEASAAAGVERLVFTSSIAVYGPHGERSVDEATPLIPFGDRYGDSKIRAERALQEVSDQTGLPVVIVRPGMVYGPGSPGWTVRLAQWAKHGQIPLIGGGRGSAYPIYIDNLIDLLVLCATHPAAPGEVFNGVDNGPVTLAEFLDGYMRMAGTTRALRLPCWLAKPVAALVDPFVQRYKLTYVVTQMCGRGQVSNKKPVEQLGWQPEAGLEEGLRRSEAWLRAEGIL